MPAGLNALPYARLIVELHGGGNSSRPGCGSFSEDQELSNTGIRLPVVTYNEKSQKDSFTFSGQAVYLRSRSGIELGPC
jgi:hypothetical protein